MRPSARTWLAAALTLTAAGAVLVPLANRLQPSPAGGDPLAERLGGTTDGEVDVQRGPDDVVRFVGTSLGTPLDLGTGDPEGAATAFVARYGGDLGVAGADLEVASTEPRRDGGVAVRYQQVVDDIPVFGAQASVQVDGDGGVLSSLVDLSAPAAETTFEAPEVTPAEAGGQALAVVARETGAEASGLTATTPEPWIYDPAVVGPPAPFGPRLTWRVEVTGDAPPVRHLVLVDAERGGIALSFSQLAHGLDRGVCDGANDRGLPEDCTVPYDRGELDPVHAEPEVNQAFDYSGDTYDFFWDTLGRDSIDGGGMTIESRVRHCPSATQFSCPYDNAFWNGQQLTFGDGYATDDVVAHELTHGVTEHTANLFYYYQSGAINESMSDVFGEFVDLQNGAGDDSAGVRWKLGEDLAGGAIRDMEEPTLHSDPDRMTSDKYTADANFLDGGGVHTNSGVGNRAASLMTDGGPFNGQTVTGLDIDKSAAVFYEALTTMLTSGSDYVDLGVALSQSCTNLVGGSSAITTADCVEVDKVVLATEMAQQPTDPAAQAPEAPVCDAGLEPQEIWADDFEGPNPGAWGFDTVDIPAVNPDYRWAFLSEVVGLEYATSGVDGLWGPDVNTTSDRRAHTVQAVSLPAGSTPYLRFRHAYHFETSSATNWDGGVVEYSTNGGAEWNDLGPLFAGPGANGYDGALVGGGTNPLAGRSAFVDRSHGYVSSRADLASLAGQDVRFRFRVGTDEIVGTDYGWFVDDVSVYTCTPIPAPGLTLTQTADQEAVVAGDDIDLHLEVHNTGNVPLTAVEVTDATAPACETLIPALAVEATETIDCTYTTVDPDDIGPWSNTATATATEIPPPGVDSNPVAVEVAAPAPAAAVTMTADQAQVTAGNDIDLHVTVENTGNVALTGVSLDAAVADLCDGPVADLAVGAEATVDCTYTTVDPDDIGPWTDTATVDAGELAAPVESSPVEVEVLAPNTPAAGVTASADQATVVAGEPIDLHVTVENTGNVVLTGITVTHSTATACDGLVADLAVGAETTVDCTYTTVDPDDIGPWTDAAAVDATELAAPVAADPVAVTVVAPAPAVEVSVSAVPDDEVDAGDPIDLTVSIENTGNVSLTGLEITAADEPDCEGPVADLAPGVTVDVDCAHQTGTEDQGPFSFAATVDADQVDPATSEAIEVLVLRAALSVTATTTETTVEVDQAVHLQAMVTNVGNVALTGITLTVPSCDTTPEPIELAPTASESIDCTITTEAGAVPPFAAVGSWHAAATVVSDKAPPATADPVQVEVTIRPHGFTDGKAWVNTAVDWITFHGIADGYANNTFRPNLPITRAQVARMVHRLAGEPEPPPGCTPPPFTDVPGWVQAAVNWSSCDPDGSDPPLLTGYPDNTFRPNRDITRGQVARFVWRFAGEPAPPPGCTPPPFTDVPGWVQAAVNWSSCDPDGSDPPLLTGYPDNTFRANQDITRGQVTRFLHRTAGHLDL